MIANFGGCAGNSRFTVVKLRLVEFLLLSVILSMVSILRICIDYIEYSDMTNRFKNVILVNLHSYISYHLLNLNSECTSVLGMTQLYVLVNNALDTLFCVVLCEKCLSDE